jgi:hypothetical protein
VLFSAGHNRAGGVSSLVRCGDLLAHQRAAWRALLPRRAVYRRAMASRFFINIALSTHRAWRKRGNRGSDKLFAR